MRKHPQFAYDMLYPVEYLRPLWISRIVIMRNGMAVAIHAGSGMKKFRSLHGIFAIVDVWDAVTSDRPIARPGKMRRRSNIFAERSGNHFDPQAVDLFLK